MKKANAQLGRCECEANADDGAMRDLMCRGGCGEMKRQCELVGLCLKM